MIFTDAELVYLRSQPLARLATQHPDGTLQNNPVTFAWNSVTQTIDIDGFRMAASRKFRNVAQNARAALVVDDLASTTPWRPRMVEVRGWAEALEAHVAGDVGDSTAGPIIRVHPTRVLSFGLEPEEAEAGWRHLPLTTRPVGV